MPTNSPSFVHFHVRTEYSLLQSMIRVRDLVERTKNLNMSAVAITDYMTLSGAVEFYIEAKGAGIKPIIGCELRMATGEHDDSENDSYRLVLLCEDKVGYQNLCQLLTMSSRNSNEIAGIVTKEMVAEHNQGLIALSGWLDGELPIHLLNREEEALEAARWYKDVFGDCLYLELVNGGLPEETIVNKRLIELGKKLDIPVVAAGYCSYLNSEGANAHKVLNCLRSGQTWPDFPKNNPSLATGYYFRSAKEMSEIFSDCPKAIANSLLIAERCCFDFDLDQIHIPSFKPSSRKSSAELLKEKVDEGFKEIKIDIEICDPEFNSRKNRYLKQLENEMAFIIKHNLADYFLIVADYLRWARDNGIPVGPGRGSSAASLINYCLGITGVNPVVHGLIYERFLRPERKICPNIVVDVGDLRWDEVIGYITEKYSSEHHVVRMLAFDTLKAKDILRDVGKVLALEKDEVDRIVQLVPNNCDLRQAQDEEPELTRIRKREPMHDQWISIAEKLEGQLRHHRINKACLVISDEPLASFAPVDMKEEQKPILQIDLKDVERLGLVGFDILGLKTLTMLNYCLENLRVKGIKLNLSRLSLDDHKTFKLLSTEDTEGVFMFESDRSKEILELLRPDCFSDLAAAMALSSRSGSLYDGLNELLNRMLTCKRNNASINYTVPQLSSILDETYGVWIYCEQILKAFMEIAGMSFIEADTLRMRFNNRLLEGSDLEEIFISGVVKKGISREKAEFLLEEIKAIVPYTFNKAHAVTYSHIAYQCAFLKANYPDEFRQANEQIEMLG